MLFIDDKKGIDSRTVLRRNFVRPKPPIFKKIISLHATLIQETFRDAFVGVDAAVAEEGPVLAGDLD